MMRELDTGELEAVTGASFADTAKGGFGLRTLYRGGVKNVTAAIGGWKLANEMYGSASLQEKWRARGAIKEFLDGSDHLPSWAPNW